MNQLKEMLEAYRNGERGLPTYDELAEVAEAAIEMTVRDHFAANALPSILEQDLVGIQAWEPTAVLNGVSAAAYWAKNAYQIADAMLIERAK